MTEALAPAWRWAPPYERTYGDIAAQVGEQLGLVPDAEQRWLLDGIFAESTPGIPLAFEVCVVAPRQNLKTATLMIAALTDLFVFKVPLHTWTAHEFDTSQKSFEDMVHRIEASDDFRRRCRRPRTAHGDEAIELLSGERIEFRARTGSAGRGATGDKVTLDEWLYGRPKDSSALIPTMVTKRHAQARYASSAGFETSALLRGLRDRGRRGGDPSLVYLEYGAERRPCPDRCAHELKDAQCVLNDRALWWQANVALRAGRITEESLANSRRSMTPEGFAREFLTWWDDPPPVGDGGALPIERWLTLADPDAPRGERVAWGADVAEDRTACIAVAWRRADGRVQVMLADELLPSTALPARAVELAVKWGSDAVAAGGPSLDVLDGTDGLRVLPVTGADFAAGCGQIADDIRDGTIRHGNQRALNDAVRGARWRSVGTSGERAFQLRGAVGVGPLAAVTRAVWALSAAKPPPPPPMAVAGADAVQTGGLATAGF